MLYLTSFTNLVLDAIDYDCNAMFLLQLNLIEVRDTEEKFSTKSFVNSSIH